MQFRSTSAGAAKTAAATSFAAFAAAALLLTACSSPTGTGEGTPVSGGTLVYATGDAEPSCLDPHVGGNYPQALISTQYLEPLVGRDASGAIVPWLASSWETSADGLSLDFTLPEGITFTDGTAFDAAAVQANIAHLQDPETQSSTGFIALTKVDGVEVIDATHARFLLSSPDAALLESLSQPWLAMQSPAGIARGMEANCQAPIGTGPFIVESWEPQQRVTLTRNDDYASPGPEATHDGPASLDRIEWRFIPDASTRQAALAAGEVNVIDNPLPSDIAAATPGSGIDHIDAPRPGSVNRIELNSGQTPFDDERVREAFVRSADPGPGIEALFQGAAKQTFSPLASTEPMAVGDEALFATDAKAAAELLDEAGWKPGTDGVRTKDGKPLTVRFPVSTNQSTAAEQSLFEQIQANTGKVGFDVQLEPVDLATWHARLGANEYEAVSAPYSKVGADVLRILYHSSGLVPAPSGYFANHSQLQDPEVDRLLTEAAAASDETVRAELYAGAQRRILASYVLLPLYDQQNHFLTTGVEGVTTLGTVGTPTFINAKLTEG